MVSTTVYNTSFPTYNSSIVSCGGKGSSKPSPIISHVNVLSSMPMPILRSPVNVRSSIVGCIGESPLRPHRSALTETIGGVLTAKSPLGTGREFAGLMPLNGLDKLSLGEGTGSWVFNKVSTCSIQGDQSQYSFLLCPVCAAMNLGSAHLVSLPMP